VGAIATIVEIGKQTATKEPGDGFFDEGLLQRIATKPAGFPKDKED
jgi:hypothetical protein